MARTRTFDEQAVIADAMTVFWRKGYEATSIDDLVQATGINRASMYGTFGSKEGLLLAALDHYVLAINRERLKLLQGKGTVRECLAAYFDSLIAFSTGDGRGLGCLLTNTAIELSPRNARIRKKLKAIFEHVETAFRRLVERGQAAGEISASSRGDWRKQAPCRIDARGHFFSIERFFFAESCKRFVSSWMVWREADDEDRNSNGVFWGIRTPPS